MWCISLLSLISLKRRFMYIQNTQILQIYEYVHILKYINVHNTYNNTVDIKFNAQQYVLSLAFEFSLMMLEKGAINFRHQLFNL